MSDDDSLKDTIIPNSNQLNADDLLCGPITVTVESVKRGDKDQPVHIGIGKDRQPFKPCKSMRRVLIAAWGDKGADWVGRSMTLYCDPSVSFGGVKVGGIRISHLSHIDGDRTFMLTTTRGKRGEFHVKKLVKNGNGKTGAELYAEVKSFISKAKPEQLAGIRERVNALHAEQKLDAEQAAELLISLNGTDEA